MYASPLHPCTVFEIEKSVYCSRCQGNADRFSNPLPLGPLQDRVRSYLVCWSPSAHEALVYARLFGVRPHRAAMQVRIERLNLELVFDWVVLTFIAPLLHPLVVHKSP